MKGTENQGNDISQEIRIKLLTKGKFSFPREFLDIITE